VAVNLVKNNLDGSPAVASPPSATDWVAPGVAIAGSKNLQGAAVIAVPLAIVATKLLVPFSLAFKARIIGTTMSYSSGGHANDTFTLTNAAAATVSQCLGSATAGKQQYSVTGLGSAQVVAAGEALLVTVVDGGNNPAGVFIVHCIPEP